MRLNYVKLYLVVIILFVFTHIAYPQSIPQKISFQGKLLENNIPVNNTKSISFEIEGTEWVENHKNVEIKNGLYSVILGSITPIPLSVFSNSSKVILKIYIEGNHLLPDTEILSVGYAFKSEISNNAMQLDEKQPADYLNIESINGITGDTNSNVNIVGEGNISVTNDQQQNTIKISGTTTPPTPSIESINGITGDENSNIKLVGEGNISVTNDQQQNAIKISSPSTSSIISINGLTGDANSNIKIIGDGNISVINDPLQNSINISGTFEASIPSGVIVMWSGSINNIPAGWALCDGTNSTPDLRNRFIVGAGDNYNTGETGGETQHTLTIAEMPQHDHLTFSDDSPRGGHYISTGGEGAWKTMGGGNQPSEVYRTGFAGNSQPHENRPPYYALAYIMKK